MTPSFIAKTILLLFLFKMLLTMVYSQNNCKGSTRGKNFIIAFPQNYGNRQSLLDLHLLIVTFHDGITEVKINSSYKLPDDTYFMQTIIIQPRSFERVNIPGELELFGTEKSLKTVEITADFEVTVDSFHLEPYTSDGFLAIPTANLGTQYVVASYVGSFSIDGTFFTIIGSQNDTIVSVQLRSEVFYDNKQYNPSETLNLNLLKYEVIQILSTNDLTGSIINSTKPIGVMSGHSCTSNPGSACDILLEQNIPVRDWGTKHFYSTTGRQNGTSIYRMIAFFNDTSFNVNGANITLNSGNFSEFYLSGNGLIVTSKPASMIQILLEINGVTIEPSIIHVPTEEQFVSMLGFVTLNQSSVASEEFINFVNIIVKSDEKSSLRLSGNQINFANASLLPFVVDQSKIMSSDYDLLVIQLPSEEAVYYITQELINSSPISAIVYGYARFISYGYVAALSLFPTCTEITPTETEITPEITTPTTSTPNTTTTSTPTTTTTSTPIITTTSTPTTTTTSTPTTTTTSTPTTTTTSTPTTTTTSTPTTTTTSTPTTTTTSTPITTTTSTPTTTTTSTPTTTTTSTPTTTTTSTPTTTTTSTPIITTTSTPTTTTTSTPTTTTTSTPTTTTTSTPTTTTTSTPTTTTTSTPTTTTTSTPITTTTSTPTTTTTSTPTTTTTSTPTTTTTSTPTTTTTSTPTTTTTSTPTTTTTSTPTTTTASTPTTTTTSTPTTTTASTPTMTVPTTSIKISTYTFTTASSSIGITPKITSPGTNITKTLNRTDTAIENIECVATGIPAPVIHWTRDFMTKFIDSPILQINITDLSTDRVFYCVAENSAGRDVVSVNYKLSLTTEVIINELDEINNGIDSVESVSDEESGQTAALAIVIIDAVNNNPDVNSGNRSRILESAVMLTQMIIEKTNGTFSNETTERITGLLSSIVDGSSTIQESEQVAVTQEQREQSTVATIPSALAMTLNTLEKFSQRLSEELANSELNSVKIVESRLITIVVQNVDLENSGDDGETKADIVLPKKSSNNVQYSAMITFSTNLALDLSTDKRSLAIATSIVRRIGSKVPAAGESTQGSDILTISLGGKSGTVELTEEVTFSFDVYSNQPLESTCVFLNGTRWVSEGLSTEQKANLTNCMSSHFTSFAVFVTPYEAVIPTKESIALSVISYLFVAISFIFLLISLILFLIAGKAFFKVEANIIYFNYCLSMLLATGLFIFGIQVGTYNIVLCQIIAFLLHYSWLAVFTWTLCIGIFIMYKIVISVLSTRKIYRYLIIFGWIFPLLISIITIAVARDYYVNVNSHCFLNVEGGVIWAFIGPILSIIVINALFLIISLIRIIQSKSTGQNNDSRKVIKDALITGLVLTPVLGLPWLILILNVAIQHSVLEWVFIFINGLMGLIFFFVVVLRNKEVVTRFKKKKYITNSNLVQFTGQNVSNTTNASYLTSDRFKKTNTLERQLKKESELQGASIEACEVYTSCYDTGDNIYAVVSGEKNNLEAGTSEIAEQSIIRKDNPIYSRETLDEPPVYQNFAETGMLTEIYINPVYSPQVVATQDDVDELYDQADVTNSDEAVYESAK